MRGMSAVHRKRDGTLDMRFKSSRAYILDHSSKGAATSVPEASGIGGTEISTDGKDTPVEGIEWEERHLSGTRPYGATSGSQHIAQTLTGSSRSMRLLPVFSRQHVKWKAKGVKLLDNGCQGDDYASFYTLDPKVAKELSFEVDEIELEEQCERLLGHLGEYGYLVKDGRRYYASEQETDTSEAEAEA
ncbi:hypothetical protein KIPB_002084 [Kipferlia bialata]|uniref:Uncharacterized protein n=1 Tax=Kipferlia bialata TaxID=797122 RepID=A0A9K3CT21_9EUKA|nr:hypothetical protein KIPB_002084 [Kipferlia bialata]|eukprot:g2084.t1